MQKVMFKGLLPEDKTLRDIKITNGAKIMVVGSTINDVLAVNTPKEVIQQEVKAEENKKEPLCRQKVGSLTPLQMHACSRCVYECVLSSQQHRKVLDKGKPDDIMLAKKGAKVREKPSAGAVLHYQRPRATLVLCPQERLPTVPLSGMFNKSGGKVRLTFKLEQDQLWIGTKGRFTSSSVSGQTSFAVSHACFSPSPQRGQRRYRWAPSKMWFLSPSRDTRTIT